MTPGEDSLEIEPVSNSLAYGEGILRIATPNFSSAPRQMLRKLSMTPFGENRHSRLSHYLRFFCLGVVLIFLPAVGGAQSRTDCSVIHSRMLKQTVHYCAQLPSDYDANDAKSRRYPVLYFLHGLGQNEQTLFSTGGWSLIEDLRRQHKISEFLIVSPEAKRTFYINSADNSRRYSDFFLQEFMPYIEAKYRVRPGRPARAVTGVSMGGYGALRFAFAHPELFGAVSAQSPALITQTPQELNAAAQSGTSLGKVLGPAFGQPINPVHWKQNSVFELARKNQAGLRKLAIYFNCGQQDDFGFEDGATALHQQLQAEGIKHEYHSYPGDHSLTYFLSHMGEVMEFHSRAFDEQK
jgi:S-formylglutathione hydrolase FrmB